MGNRDMWYVEAATDMLAAGRGELRKALAEVVREAVARGWVDAGKAEGWPEYHVGLKDGALVVSFASTDPDSI